MNCNFIIKN